MKKIIHVFDVQAPTSKVYEALTTRDGMVGWWTANVTFEKGVGGKIKFYFSDDFQPQMEVIRLEPNQLVQWKCIGGIENWLSDQFTFTLKDQDGHSHVMFTQEYTQELSDDVYGNYNYNWGYFMDSIRSYCETGKGKPYQP